MKYYPTFIITKEELNKVGLTSIPFNNKKLSYENEIEYIEDYCGRPIIMVYPSPIRENEIIAFIADGYIQYNSLSNKRTVVLKGNLDTLKVILADIIKQRPDKTPSEIFDFYAYQTDVVTQYKLKQWIEETYEG